MEIDETNKKHMMFSYSWKQKGRVRHIYDLLEEQYPNVPKWIDINQMQGNIIEAMGDAVENSFIVIIFLSKDYKNSKNCKTESELIIGKQKKYLLVLIDDEYPFLENEENDNWLSRIFKNQFYIDLRDMDQTNLNKLKELVHKEIISYYKIDETIYKRPQTKPSFSSNNSLGNLKKKNSKNSITSKYSPLKGSPIITNISQADSKELDHFILNNNLDQDDIDTIKNLVIKTPRTMVPTLKASGISFKGILNIISDIKNEESFREDDQDIDIDETDYS
tara:strand:- start:322 stop:1152 length:831 start_codon:yes stop_codon:yes gene_type:complete